MSAEIASQSAVWSRIVASPEVDKAAAFIERAAPEIVVLAARGTSDHAAIYGQYLMQAKLGLPGYLATPSLATLYGNAPFPKRSLLVAISQSGASPDLLATVAAARAQGVPSLAMTNSGSSALAVAADEHLDLDAGVELSVAATKTYTAELVAIFSLVQRLLRSPDGGRGSIARLVEAFDVRLPSLIEHADALAQAMNGADRVLVIGRGYSYATAKEGALKLMETSAIAASGWSAADAKHGPLGQVSDATSVVLLTASPVGRESVVELIPSILSKTAQLDIVTSDAAGGDTGGRVHRLVPADLHDALIPVLEIVPLQLAALSLSRLRGRDADRPPGLSKVTLTT